MKIVMVLTSHDQLGNTGRKTGFWLEEFAAPYFRLQRCRCRIDPRLTEGRPTAARSQERSAGESNAGDGALQERQDGAEALANTLKLADMKSEDFDTVFYPGGHGPMWDLAERPRFDCFARIVLQFRQADRAGLPFARRASPRHLPRRAAGKGKARDRLYERRGGRDEAHEGCAVPRRR